MELDVITCGEKTVVRCIIVLYEITKNKRNSDFFLLIPDVLFQHNSNVTQYSECNICAAFDGYFINNIVINCSIRSSEKSRFS